MRNTRRRLEKGSVVWGTKAREGRPGAAGRRRQRDVLCDVMLSASQCETWLTLEELAKLTHYPPASISAQLRHLRKEDFGGYEVEKRQRLSGRILHGEDFGTVWEYRLEAGREKDSAGARAGYAARREGDEFGSGVRRRKSLSGITPFFQQEKNAVSGVCPYFTDH